MQGSLDPPDGKQRGAYLLQAIVSRILSDVHFYSEPSYLTLRFLWRNTSDVYDLAEYGNSLRMQKVSYFVEITIFLFLNRHIIQIKQS